MENLKILWIGFLVLGFWACDPVEQIDSKNPVRQGDIYLIKQVDFGRLKQQFYYNDENLLVRWMFFEEDQLKQIHDYDYLEDRKREHEITIFEEEEKYVVSGIEIFDKNYHPIHTISANVYTENRAMVVEKEETDYTYNSDGEIVQRNYYTQDELVAYSTFKVSEEGNVEEEKFTELEGAGSETIYSYAYDDKKHYTHFWTYGVGGEPVNNNIVEGIYSYSTGWKYEFTASYEYNEMGLPTKRVITSSDGRSFEATYEYERR